MEIRDYIKYHIKQKNMTNLSVSEKLGINYKTFVGKLNRESITADELLKISTILDINLEKMKRDLGYILFLDTEIEDKSKENLTEKDYKIENILESNKNHKFKESENNHKEINKTEENKIEDKSINKLGGKYNITSETGSIRFNL